jgi:hypothetical protein
LGEIGSRLATIVAIGLRKTYAKSESDANRVMYIMMFIDLLCGCCFTGVQLRNQNTLSQGKKKKGDEVEDEDDDVVARTSVSQDRVTATLCNYSSALGIYMYCSSPHISGR